VINMPQRKARLLSNRQREVLGLLIRGKSEKDIAVTMQLSPHTVHVHVKAIYKRLFVRSRAELFRAIYQEIASKRGRHRRRESIQPGK